MAQPLEKPYPLWHTYGVQNLTRIISGTLLETPALCGTGISQIGTLAVLAYVYCHQWESTPPPWHDRNKWLEYVEEKIFIRLKSKFEQNEAARNVLLSTGKRTIAECNPNDKEMAIGLSLYNAQRFEKSKWGGNYIGRLLEHVWDVITLPFGAKKNSETQRGARIFCIGQQGRQDFLVGGPKKLTTGNQRQTPPTKMIATSRTNVIVEIL